MSCLTRVYQLPFRVLYEFVLSSQQLADLGSIISSFQVGRRWGPGDREHCWRSSSQWIVVWPQTQESDPRVSDSVQPHYVNGTGINKVETSFLSKLSLNNALFSFCSPFSCAGAWGSGSSGNIWCRACLFHFLPMLDEGTKCPQCDRLNTGESPGASQSETGAQRHWRPGQ